MTGESRLQVTDGDPKRRGRRRYARTFAVATTLAITIGGLLARARSGSARNATAIAAPVREGATRAPSDTGSCFLLYEVGVGMRRREPSRACSWRLSPASTFKVPHAIAALAAGLVAGPDEVITYDGTPNLPEFWRKDHTLVTAMRYSVVWYFQALATRLGMPREQAYLTRLDFGNADPSSALTTFWLGGSLEITPDEQLRFWRRLFADSLPVPVTVMQQVRGMLVQPEGSVVNAMGVHPFAQPWPRGTVVSAKTGSTSDRSGRGIRWLIGDVKTEGREFLFVACVAGTRDLAADAAVRLAEQGLRAERVM